MPSMLVLVEEERVTPLKLLLGTQDRSVADQAERMRAIASIQAQLQVPIPTLHLAPRCLKTHATGPATFSNTYGGTFSIHKVVVKLNALACCYIQVITRQGDA